METTSLRSHVKAKLRQLQKLLLCALEVTGSSPGGNHGFEGLISAFPDQLSVQVVQGPHRHKILFDGEQGTAFAAILADGSVFTWGHPDRGGDRSAVRDQLRNVQLVQATAGAFAAILADGSVVTWGDPHTGGDSFAVRDQTLALSL